MSQCKWEGGRVRRSMRWEGGEGGYAAVRGCGLRSNPQSRCLTPSQGNTRISTEIPTFCCEAISTAIFGKRYKRGMGMRIARGGRYAAV